MLGPWRNHARLRRVANHSLRLRLLPLRSYLLLRSTTLLLRSNHLLPRCFSLRLLLLPNRSALSLLLHLLAHAFGLRLTRDARACGRRRSYRLFP